MLKLKENDLSYLRKDKLDYTFKFFHISNQVHLLNDESRGPSMEAVISRMKTVKTAQSRARNQKEIFGANMRFLAISATIPNAHDVSQKY